MSHESYVKKYGSLYDEALELIPVILRHLKERCHDTFDNIVKYHQNSLYSPSPHTMFVIALTLDIMIETGLIDGKSPLDRNKQDSVNFRYYLKSYEDKVF